MLNGVAGTCNAVQCPSFCPGTGASSACTKSDSDPKTVDILCGLGTGFGVTCSYSCGDGSNGVSPYWAAANNTLCPAGLCIGVCNASGMWTISPNQVTCVPAPSANSGSGSSSNTGLVVGIIILAVVVLIAIAAVIVSRKQKSGSFSPTPAAAKQPESDTVAEGSAAHNPVFEDEDDADDY